MKVLSNYKRNFIKIFVEIEHWSRSELMISTQFKGLSSMTLNHPKKFDFVRWIKRKKCVVTKWWNSIWFVRFCFDFSLKIFFTFRKIRIWNDLFQLFKIQMFIRLFTMRTKSFCRCRRSSTVSKKEIKQMIWHRCSFDFNFRWSQ